MSLNAKALSSSSDLAEAFLNSPAGQAVIQELDDDRGGETALADNRSAPALKDFAQPMSRQIQLLIGRGWKLVKRNPANLMRIVSAIVSTISCLNQIVISVASFISPCLRVM